MSDNCPQCQEPLHAFERDEEAPPCVASQASVPKRDARPAIYAILQHIRQQQRRST